jgi:hypothetical protein
VLLNSKWGIKEFHNTKAVVAICVVFVSAVVGAVMYLLMLVYLDL